MKKKDDKRLANNKQSRGKTKALSVPPILAVITRTKEVASARRRVDDLLKRRPHRSFKRTYRRDYVRSLKMPGFWAFSNDVRRLLWQYRRLFLTMMGAYALLTLLVVNLASESTYADLRVTLNESGGETFQGVWGEIGKAGLLLVSGVTGAFNEAPTSGEASAQVYTVIIILLTWLTTVWLLRALLAGHRPRFRDGLYNSGAPLVSTFLVALLAVLQMLPITLALFGYNSAVTSGLLEGGVEAMLFWTVAALLLILSLYWLSSTFIALIVVTLPGMYPMKAVRTAGDLVIGRRLRILLRLLWLGLCVVIGWAVIVIPIILLDGWLKSSFATIAWMPIVPVTLLLMNSLTVIIVACYIYLLYRRIVEDDALPA